MRRLSVSDASENLLNGSPLTFLFDAVILRKHLMSSLTTQIVI